MSHATEGELHAYLDGALEFYPARQARRIRDHLERCTECRKRVEQEGRLIGSSRTLLTEAAPGELAPPPLEELRRRADLIEVVEAKPVRAPAHLRWAWAATVVLALGIGWGVGAWPGGGRRSASSEEAAPVEPASPEYAAPPTVSAEAPVVAEVGAAPSGPASDAAAGNVARREDLATPPARVAAAESGAPQPSADASAGASKASSEASAVDERTVVLDRMVDRRPAPQLSPEPLVPDGSDRLAGLRDAQTVAAAAPPPPVDVTAGAGRARRSEQPAAERPLVAQTRIAVGSLPELRVPGGRPLTADTPPTRLDGVGQTAAERMLSRPPVSPLALPGLTVESVEWRGVGAVPTMLIRAHDVNGAEVELRLVGQWVADASQAGSPGRADAAASGASAAPALPPSAPAPLLENIPTVLRNPTPGWEQVARPYRGGWVIAQGPLSQDRLRALLQAAGVP